jgi:hypothetical protein
MLDRGKLATLVHHQSGLPPPPATLMAKKAAPPAPGAAKPEVKPAVDVEKLTPQEMADLVEQAASAAEAKQDPEVEDALVDYMHGDTSAPPVWAGNAELWQKAMEAVGVGTPDEAKYDEPYAVTAYLYKALGGPMAGEGAPHVEPAGGAPPHASAPPKAPVKPVGAPIHPQPGGLHAKPGAPAAAKAPIPGAGASIKPALALAKKPGFGAKPPVKPGIGNPALKQPPVHGQPGQGVPGGDELKQLLDQAAEQAKSNPDPEVAELLKTYDPQRDGNPPPWAADADKWAKAEEAVKPHAAEYDDFYAVVAHVYKNMGGAVSK